MLSQVQLLKKYRIRIRGHLGQHLLMDPNTIRKIADGLLLGPGEPVFEIGPGLGAVTVELLSRGHPVLAVEKDPKFVEVLNTEIAPHFPGKLEVVHRDILECDLTKLIHEKGLTPFSETKGGQSPFSEKAKKVTDPKKKGSDPIKVVGNLPYYISTPILFHLIEHRDSFHAAVFTLQKEVAARMTARPGEEDYGRLSVSAGVFGKTEALFDISPKCFLPAPEVTSRVVRYTFREGLQLEDEAFLLEVIRIAFGQRRKTLLSLFLKGLKAESNSPHSTAPACHLSGRDSSASIQPQAFAKDCLPGRGRKTRAELETVFGKLGFAPNVRGEELTTAQFIALSEALKRGQAPF